MKKTYSPAPSTPFRLNLHVGDVGHTLVFGPTGAGKTVSLRELLTPAERAALDAWASLQQPDGSGVVNLMRWPGWAERAARIASAKADDWQ